MAKPSAHLKIKAPAKINLFLSALKKRPDGYHDLYSVLQMVSLYDELTFEPTTKGVSLVNSSQNLPLDGRNLVIRAARSLAHAAGIKSGVHVTLKKNIPIGAGLGGGSSDAAATLVALNRLWGLGLTCDDLARMGQDLGSDVPFFLHGPTAFVSGRGGEVIPCVLDRDRWLVLINPGFEVSTRWVYEQFSLSQLAKAPGRRNLSGPKNSWLTNIQRNTKIQGSSKFRLSYSDLDLHNDLESVTEPEYPVVTEMKECLRSGGAEGVLMSGSGPTVFGVFKERVGTWRAARKLKQEHPGWKIWAVKSLRRSPF